MKLSKCCNSIFYYKGEDMVTKPYKATCQHCKEYCIEVENERTKTEEARDTKDFISTMQNFFNSNS